MDSMFASYERRLMLLYEGTVQLPNVVIYDTSVPFFVNFVLVHSTRYMLVESQVSKKL